MSDAQRRAIRSLFQTGSGAVIFAFTNVMGWTKLTPEQMAALLALWAIVASFVQNWLEDNTEMPALLKGPVSSGQNPTPDDAGSRR